MPNYTCDEYLDDAYDAGKQGYWDKEMQPPKDMPSNEKQSWYQGYRDAYKRDLEAYNE